MNKLGWRIAGTVVGLLAAFVFYVAAAAYFKSHNTAVVRAGFMEEYMKACIIAAGTGLILAGMAVFAFTRKPKAPPPQDSHF